MMKKWLNIILVFALGYMFNDVINSIGHELVSDAQAEVAGMDHKDLRRDGDFKKAVRYVVESDCSISGGYVEDGVLYGASISCY